MAKKERTNKHPDWRLSTRERFNYYLSDSGRLFGTSVFQTYMTSFLALRGVNLALLAGVLLVLKIIDAVDDVVFGYLIDKLKITEWKAFRKLTGEGKYLPWFRLTFFLFPLFTILFYLMPSALPVWAKVAWFIVTYLLYDFSCTLCEVPMNSLVMTLTDNTDERTHILTVKGIVTMLAAVIVGVTLNLLVDPVAGPGFSFTGVAIVAVLICTAIMIPLVIHGREYNTELRNVEEDVTESYTLRDMWNCVKTNKYMMIYLLSTLVSGAAATSSAVSGLVSFYLFGGSTIVASLPVLIAFVPALVINTQADKIAKKFGRRNSMLILGLVFGGMYLLQYIAGYENVPVFIILGTIAGLANSVRYVFMNFIAPDTIEYTRYKTGKDCSGIFYSLNSFVSKATASVGGSIGLLVMGLYGWNEVQAESYEELLAMGMEVGQAAYQTPQAIHGMWVVYALIPGIGYILSAIVLWFYNLRDKDAELMAKCNGGEITRAECEAQLSRKY
ncbi:MAG: MFS transporter [Oscillospiraceae bacterium]|nr:MFS transporter [Oscillospiraceae bacterium]